MFRRFFSAFFTVGLVQHWIWTSCLCLSFSLFSKIWWRRLLWHYFCFQTPDRVWDRDFGMYKYNQKLRDNAALWAMLFTAYYDCGKEACRLFPVPKKKIWWHTQGFSVNHVSREVGLLIAPHLKRRDRQTKEAVCVALLAPGHGREAESCVPQTWPSCAIVSAGAPAGRWSAQSLMRPTRLQLLPTCGASQIREGVLLMGPLVCGSCKRSTCVCVWECWKGTTSLHGLCVYSTLNPPATHAVQLSITASTGNQKLLPKRLKTFRCFI